MAAAPALGCGDDAGRAHGRLSARSASTGSAVPAQRVGCEKPATYDPAPAYGCCTASCPPTIPTSLSCGGRFCGTIESCREIRTSAPSSRPRLLVHRGQRRGWLARLGYLLSRPCERPMRADVQAHVLTSTGGGTPSTSKRRTSTRCSTASIDGRAAPSECSAKLDALVALRRRPTLRPDLRLPDATFEAGI